MRSIEEAVIAADERKNAVFHVDDGPPQVAVSDAFQQSAIFSGFGVDMDELMEVSRRAAYLFSQMAVTNPLLTTHQGAWTDGLLIGLYLAQQEDE